MAGDIVHDLPSWMKDMQRRVVLLERRKAGSGGGDGTTGTDHGALTGLGDDDHPQYHTNARGDARYAPLSHNHDAAYLAPAEVLAGANVTVDRTTSPGSVIISSAAGGAEEVYVGPGTPPQIVDLWMDTDEPDPEDGGGVVLPPESDANLSTDYGSTITAGAAYQTAIGAQVSMSGAHPGATAVGCRSAVAGQFGVAMGYGSNAGGAESLALGHNVYADMPGGVAIGTDSLGIGARATAADEIVLGTNKHKIHLYGPLNVQNLIVGNNVEAGNYIGFCAGVGSVNRALIADSQGGGPIYFDGTQSIMLRAKLWTGGGTVELDGQGVKLPADAVQPLHAATKQQVDAKWTKWSGTQAEYDAIATKDPSTLYVVV